MISILAIFMFILGGIFLFIGLEFIFAPTLFKCDRLRNICYREERHIWSKKSKVEQLCALSDITEVRVKSSYDDGTTMYQVVLELKNGDAMSIFNSSSSVKSHHEKDAEAIRQFLKFGLSTQHELLIRDNFFVGGIIFMIFGIIFICAGGGIAVASYFA